jgi:hypothetical protein
MERETAGSPAGKIEQRVARLERENRRLRFAVVAALLAWGAVFLVGQAAPRKDDAAPAVVKARAFRVVDGSGVPRAAFGANPDGVPYLTLSDAKGQVRATLYLADDGRPALSLNDRSGNPRAAIGLERTETGFIAFSDDKGKQTWAAP